MGHIQFVTVTTLIVCSMCIGVREGLDRKYFNETSADSLLDSSLTKSYIINDYTLPEEQLDSIDKIARDKRARPNITEDDRITDSENVEAYINKSNVTLTAVNNNEKLDELGNKTNESNVIPSDIEYTTEDYDTFNATEEPCVGDPEFCNMTKEEYLAMLNDYIYPQSYEWVLIATHAIVFVIGLIGNALVCVAVYRNHSMRTVTNYFIVNLAVADFMVILICLPPTVLWDVTETWFFGTAMCRIVLYFQSVSVTVSVLTLTFISVDRWYAICFPLKFKSTTGRAKTAILIIWLLSLLFNVPEFVVLQVQKNMQLRFNVQYFMQCTSTWSDASDLKWHIIKALFCTRLAASRRTTPSIHANASTEGQLRSRRKAAKMLVAVVIMFAVCYFPVHLLSVLRVAYDVQQSDVMTCIALISHVMCYANSAVNPLIYNFMSGKFRREFHRSYFKCFCCCYTPPGDRNGASFGPISSRGTTRTVVRRNDSCASYRLTHLSPSERRGPYRAHPSCVSHTNGDRPRIRDEAVSESTRFTLDTGRD